MNRRARSCPGAFVGALVGLAFGWTLVLSVSPQLHERIHPDASRIHHTCAATFIASGNYEHLAHPPLITAPNFTSKFSRFPTLVSLRVESSFLLASIFEHAPPAVA